MADICGCGECKFCQDLTKEFKGNLTFEQQKFDRDVTVLNGTEEDEDDGA